MGVEPIMTPEATDLQRKFRSQGWNVAGANLLAVACLQAKSVYLYFRCVWTV